MIGARRQLRRVLLAGDSARRAALVHGARGGARPDRLRILVYHRVTARPDPPGFRGAPAVHPRRFRAQLDFLATRYRFVDLRELDAPAPPDAAPPLAISFDDGYRCVWEEALPELARRGIPATCFLTLGLLDNRRLGWRDQIGLVEARGLGDELLDFLRARDEAGGLASLDGLVGGEVARWSKDPARISSLPALRDSIAAFLEERGIDVAELAARLALHAEARDVVEGELLSFGNHSLTHPLLTALSLEEQIAELEPGRRFLAERGVTDVGVACPFDPHDTNTLEACRRLGYRRLFHSSGGSNPWPRIGADGAGPELLDRKNVPASLVAFANALAAR